MTNINDEFGLACPNCRQQEAVCILMTCMTHVTAERALRRPRLGWHIVLLLRTLR